MKRLLPALLSALLLAGCSSAPAADEDDGFKPVFGEDSASKEETQSDKSPEQNSEPPLHSCTWEGKDGVREDIRVFGSSEDAPFTKVELIQYIPSDMDFQNTDEKDIQDYLAKSKAAVADETGFDPSLITMGWEDNDLTITFTCQTLEQLQKIHDFYYDDTVSFIYKTAYDMEGTTACDGQSEERPKADIKDFDKDMNTIQEWNSANAANIESFWDGTMDPDSSTDFTNSMDEIGNLIRKWKYNTDLLDDQQKQTFEEVKKARSYALTGS